MRPLDPSIVRHLRPATPSMAGLVAASVAASGLLIAQAFALTHLLVALARGATAELPLAAAMVAGVVVARAVVGYLGDLCAAHASATVSRHLRRRLVHAMLGLSARESSSRRTGELSLLATRGVAATEPYLTRYLPALLLAVVLPPLTVVAIATQDLLAALIVLLTLPLVPLFAVLVGMATRDRADRQWAALSGLAGHFVDVVKGLPTLVAHGRADAQSTTIRRVTDRHRVATLSTLRLAFASSAVLELVATLSVALVAVVVGLRLATGSLDLATALVVLLLAPEAYWPLRRVGAEFHAAAEGTAAFAAAEEIVAGVPTPVAAATGPDRTAPWPGVSVSGLTVRYPGRTAPALDLAEDLDLPARGLVAVVGPSGSGKSTLLAALAGELVPDRGRIGSGDLLLDADSVDRWREQVAWLPQRPWLTSGSVRDNLTLARAGVGDTELWAALSRVGLREVVAGLPGGLSATVGEDGERLSAGQRARLALARAVVAGRPLVLVDEPSAHLDRDSEQVVVETLVWLAHRSTVVVVTHSPAVMTSASRVVRLAEPVLPEPAPAGPVPAEPVLRAQSRARVPAVAEPSPQGGSGRGRWALSVALGVLAAASGVALTVTSGWLIARASQHPPILFLTVAIVGVRAFGIARPALRYAERLVGHDSALRMLADRRADVYDTVVPLTPGALGRRRGDVLATLVDDVDALLDDRLRVRSPLIVLVGVGLLGAVFGVLLVPVTGLLVVALVGCTLLVAALVRWRVSGAEPEVVRQRSLLSARVLTALHGARDLVLWQATPGAEAGIDEAGQRLDAATRASASSVALGRALVTAAAGACVAAIALLVAPAVSASAVSMPMGVALLLLPVALLEVLATAPDAAAASVRTRAAMQRLVALAATAPAVTTPSDPLPPPSPRAGITATGLAGGWAQPAFAGLDLEVLPGHRVGVVGPSGSGKSTLAATLVRFLDPAAGRVAIDADDLLDLDLGDVRRHVGLVDDDPYVFSSSVLENVRLARPAATGAEVETAVRAVSLGPWLDALPDGLDTLVGEGQAGVSGGERARLGLARAVLADAPVLVLDEPTAHLDASTARAVAADVLRATEGRAVVWITHDDVALDAMDRVVDLTAYAQPG